MITYFRGRAAGAAAALMLLLSVPYALKNRSAWTQAVANQWVDISVAACVAVIGFALAWLLTPLARVAAFRTNCLDIPNARKIHKQPTPLLGGVAIFVALGATMLLGPALSRQMIGIVIGSGIILIIGVIDDSRGLPAVIRLAGQVAAVSVVVSQGVILSFLPHTRWGQIGEVLLTLTWIVGITNALNFLDGMDGLAGGLSAISAAAFCVIAGETREVELMVVTSALFGACLGFLVFNFKPAVIFLGDAGATFLGFFLASVAVMGTYTVGDNVVTLTIPLLILGIIIYDIIFITISRIYRGVVRSVKEWLEYVGRDHLHHRLRHLGLSQKQTVLFIWLLSAFMGISAVVLVTKSDIDKYLVIVMSLVMFVVITVLMELGRRGIQNGQAEPSPKADDEKPPDDNAQG